MIKKKVVWLPYDFDTAIGYNNEGAYVFSYNLEDTDHVDGEDGEVDVFNGQASVVWNNIRRAFRHELQVMYRNLRSDGILSYETVERMFDEHQDKWPEAIFNEDSWFKYIDPLENGEDYLYMAAGSKEEQRKWWLYNRFRYLDSKYKAGNALSDLIQIRGYAKADITITPYADIYPTVKYGSTTVRKRGERNVPTLIPCPLDNVNDTEIYIYSASQLASVGDLSGFKVGFADFSMATKLQSIKLGDASSSYSNPNLTGLNVGNNTLLGTVDIRNCGSLSAPVDLSGASNVEHVYFDGTAVTAVSLPVGGILKTLHLPGTVTNLTVRNQPMITDFSMPSYANITTLRIENSPAIPVADILEVIPANSRVRLIGFNATMSSTAEVEEFYDFLDTMRGLDEAGNNTDKAVVSGTISGLGSIDGEWLGNMQARYPNITIEGTVNSVLSYYNYDGTVLIDTETITGTGDGQKAATLRPSAAQDRPDDAQYDYTFVGWSREKNATAADPDATKNIRGNRNVYAAYHVVVNKYTVTWLDDDGSTLKTEQYEYGQTPNYGTMPSKQGITALGWDPEVVPVTGIATYTAKYGYRVRFYNGTTLLKQVNNVSPGTVIDYIDADHPDNPTKNGYRFDGWTPAVAAVTDDVDYYAKFIRLYTVRFYNTEADVGGTALKTVTNVDHGTSIATIIASQAPATNPPANKVFEAWSPASGTVEHDTNIFATYYDVYTVEFYNDPTATTPLYTVNNLRAGETAVYAGTTPTIANKDFNGQWIPSNTVNPADANANNVIKCYAQYTDKHTVRFLNVDSDHVLQTVYVSDGERADYTGAAFEHPYNNVLQFQGWNPSLTTPITANTDFVAVYEPSFTVRFYADSAKTQLLKTVNYVESGGNAAFGTDPTKTGYRFDGWTPEPTGITADTDCIAQWTQIFTVTFMNQAGTTTLTTVDVESGGNAAYPATAPTPTNTDGTTFLGWAGSANQNDPVANILENISGNKTVFAAHNPAYTVTFKKQDGTGNALQTTKVEKGGNVTYTGTTPSNDDGTGFSTDFLGWASATNATAVTAGVLDNIQANKTVYAAHKAWFTVTFMNGSTTLTTKKVQTGGTVTYDGTTPVDPDGNDFLGWAATDGASDADANILKNITADKTVYAVFAAGFEDVEITDDWDIILANIDNDTYKTKYKLGNYKPLDLGAQGIINMQIVAMNEDDMADGSGKAPVTMIAKNLLVDPVKMSNGSVATGWEASNVRSVLDTTIRSLIPANVMAHIKPVTKYSTRYENDVRIDNAVTTDDLWIPSSRELGFTSSDYSYETLGPVYDTVYKGYDSRVKRVSNYTTTEEWWTRSTFYNKNNCFAINNKGERSASSYPNVGKHILLGFCLGA